MWLCGGAQFGSIPRWPLQAAVAIDRYQSPSVLWQQLMPLGAVCIRNGNGTSVLVVAAFAGSYRNIFFSSFLCFDSLRSCDSAQHSCILPQVRVVCVCIGFFYYVFVLYNIKQWKTLFRKLIVGNEIPM